MKLPAEVRRMSRVAFQRLSIPVLLLLLTLPCVVQAQFSYRTNNGAITITGYDCLEATAIIPDSIGGLPVTSIGKYGFHDCATLTRVTIPGSVTQIGERAFYICRGLTDVTIPDSVTEIGSEAFRDCSSLRRLAIGSGVTNIGRFVVTASPSLTTIDVDPANPTYSSWEGVLFDKTRTTLIQHPEGRPGDYSVPDGVITVGDSAFLTSVGVTGITIPDSVVTIGDRALAFCFALRTITIGKGVTDLGSGQFAGCTNLAAVYFMGNAPALGDAVFDAASNATVYFLPGTTGWGPTFGGRPTAPWVLPRPLILTHDLRFGVQSNGLSFVISWATNVPVVVEASTNSVGPVWSPISTNTLIGGTSSFSDPEWTNHSSRFYRLRGW